VQEHVRSGGGGVGGIAGAHDHLGEGAHGEGHDGAGGDETGGLVLDGFQNIEGFFGAGGEDGAEGILGGDEADDEGGGNDEAPLRIPRQRGFLLGGFGFEILPDAEAGGAEQGRDGDAGDGGERFGVGGGGGFVRGGLFGRLDGGGERRGEQGEQREAGDPGCETFHGGANGVEFAACMPSRG
jgi:hypothetical protein